MGTATGIIRALNSGIKHLAIKPVLYWIVVMEYPTLSPSMKDMLYHMQFCDWIWLVEI
jgi:hypothetical protein